MKRASVWPIARLEARTQLRDGRVKVAALFMAIVCAAALFIGWRRQVEAVATLEAAQKRTYEQFLDQGRKNPHSGAHFGVYAYRSEGPLAFIDPGLDDATGVAIFVEPHAPSRFRDAPLQDKTALARFGELTGAQVLTVLGPLFIIFLLAPSIAKERERGTLLLLLAQGTSRRAILFGKLLGGGAIVLGVLSPAVIAMALVIAFGGSSAPPFGRIALVTLGFILYLLVFMLAALAISARAKSVSSALVGGIAVWALVAVVGPRFAADVARGARPTPSAFAFQKDLDKEGWGNDFARWDTKEEEIKRVEMARYGVTREADLPINIAGLVLKAQEEEDAPGFDRSYGSLFGTFESQEGILRGASIFAPSIAVRNVSMAGAGTDLAHRIEFWWAVERYRRGMVAIVNDYITTRSKTPDGYAFTADREMWSLVPAFTYQSPSSSFACAHAWSSLAVLFGWVALVGLIAERSVRRMAVNA